MQCTAPHLLCAVANAITLKTLVSLTTHYITAKRTLLGERWQGWVVGEKEKGTLLALGGARVTGTHSKCTIIAAHGDKKTNMKPPFPRGRASVTEDTYSERCSCAGAAALPRKQNTC